jgi:hypothetical protein
MNTGELDQYGAIKHGNIGENHQRDEYAGYREDYDEMRRDGWLGNAITLQEFAAHNQLRIGLIKAVQYSSLSHQPPNIDWDFDRNLYAQGLCSLAKKENILGPTAQPIHLLWSNDLLASVFTQLEEHGVDLSEYGVGGDSTPQLTQG